MCKNTFWNNLSLGHILKISEMSGLLFELIIIPVYSKRENGQTYFKTE